MPEYCPEDMILNKLAPGKPDKTEPGQQALDEEPGQQMQAEEPEQAPVEEPGQPYGSRKQYLDSLSIFGAALYLAALGAEIGKIKRMDPGAWEDWLTQEVDDKGEVIEIVE